MFGVRLWIGFGFASERGWLLQKYGLLLEVNISSPSVYMCIQRTTSHGDCIAAGADGK